VAAYAAFDPEVAARFANYDPMEKPKNTLKEQGHIYPLHVRATNIFDIANPKHRELVSLTRYPAKAEERHYKNLPDDKYPWDWHDLEHNTHKIKKAGFDSFYDYETNALSKDPPSGIGVFDPAQIKSATGNNGQYDPSEPEINKAEGGEVDVQYDNPGGNWLKHQREDAEVVVQKRGNIGASGALTAWSKPVHVDPAKLSKIPGSMNERPEPGTPNYDDLYKSMSAEGYKNNNYVLVGINHRGEPHIIEGNHRAAVARDLGVKSIPAKFHWFAGGEQADGFKPEHIKSLMPDITKAEGGAVSGLDAGFGALGSPGAYASLRTSPYDYTSSDDLQVAGNPGALKTARGMDYGAAYEQKFGYNPLSLKALEQGVTRPDAQQVEQFNSAWEQDHPYVAPTYPKGLSHPGGISTMALVNWYNEKTGQRYTAGGGGMEAEPGSGWRIVKSDSYDGQGKLVSQDPINMPGFVGPNYSAPSSPAAPSTPNPAPNYQTVGTTPTSPVYGATPPAPPTTLPSTTTTTPATPATPEPQPATPEPQPATPAPPPVLGATTPAPVNGTPQPVQPVPGMVAPSPQSPPPVLGATTPAPVNGTPQPVQVPTDISYGITRTNAKAGGGAVEETVPEAPHTLESQLQAFLQGKRKAVLYTHEEPAPPEGAQRLETAHGVFHYNPALIDERSIKAAVAGDRINEILGYGPYSKKDVLNRVSAGGTPLAVVGRDAEGREVVAAAGTHGTANEQASAIAAQLPTGGQVHIESPQQVISERIAALRTPEQGNKDARKALMIARAMGGRIGKADGGGIDDAAPVPAPVTKGPKTVFTYGRSSISETKNPKRIMFTSDAPGKVKGIVTPRHMWEGGNGKGGIHIPGMEEINEARANVYGSENRPPLTVGKLADIHQNTLAEHFQKPVQQQMADESAALGRLRAAMHIGKTANTLDESEKLDTVRHEYDDQGRSYLAYGAKGTAGHTVYTSGAGDNRKFHVVNTCAGQTGGCGGGVDKNGIVDTSKGACFAPNAEAQYVGAAVRRAAHEQAKFDPAMTQDWVLAHTGSLRAAANNSDRSNKVTLFRPNIVDETDRSTRHVIRGLNKQRIAEGKPAIIANSYGKTAELHDPENGYFVTYSNTGPKTKLGASIAENISRDKSRVHATVMANEASGKDYVNEDGNLTPPKNSYAVTDVQRGSDLDKRMQGAFTHVKYWTAGRDEKSLSPEEINEGAEGHYDGSGNPTTPMDSHYGHSTLNGMRYDYQRQHILHPRLVHVGENKDGSPHMIPTDSRFKDDDYLPENRFMTKNGKQAGAVLLTTPTTSTSSIGHQSSFTHHVDDANVSHALNNNGEYEIDPPAQQQASAGNEYEPPKGKETYAHGGFVTHDENGDLLIGFPEQSFLAQKHNSHKLEDTNNSLKSGAIKKTSGYLPPVRSSAVEQALKLTSKSGATLPAAVSIARQHQRRD
jgi:hypothetical protein